METFILLVTCPQLTIQKVNLFENLDMNSNKGIGGINNVRHVRNIESQLSHLANLSDSSIFRNSQHQHSNKDRENSLLLG